MKMLFVFLVVITVFFGYMFVSLTRNVERVNDAADLMAARYAR